MRKFALIIFLLSGCSKNIMISSSDLQTKMKIESEKQRVDQRDKKIFFISIIAVYGIVMKKIADAY